MKKKLSTILVLVMILSLLACGIPSAMAEGESKITNAIPLVAEQYANSAKVRHDSIVLIANGDPGNLLPQDTQIAGKECLDSIFEKLYIIDGFGGDPLPCIATALPTDNGDGTYDITIHDNVYDHDGNHLTASDVAFSFNWLTTNSTPQNMGKFKSAEAVDEYTVRFTCDPLDGVSDIGNLFCQQWIFTEKAMNDHNFATEPVGTGPYKIVKLVAGSEVILTANDQYWAEGQDYQLARHRTNVQNVTYKFISEASQQANALRVGEADYSNSIASTDLPDFLNDGAYANKFGAYSYLDNLTYYLAPNCDPISPCNDENLRKAILYAVDGATAAMASGNSTAEVVYDVFNSKFPEYRDSWYTDENYYTAASLETAKNYLAQSSYSGQQLVLITPDAPPACQNVATVAAIVLQNLGIKVELKIVSSSIIGNTMADPGAWDLVIRLMASDNYGVVDIARLMSKGSYGGDQETINFIKDDRLQELVALCNTAAGHTDENTQALHDYIIEHAYARGLFATTTYNICTNAVTQMTVSFKNNILPGGCVYADNEF